MACELKSLSPLIQVFDMLASLAFYRDVLGFDSVSGGDDWRLLRNGGAWLMLNTAYDAGERPPRPDAVRVAAHDDTGLYFDCASVDDIHAHLVAKGVSVDPPKTAPYGMRQLTLHDPDGYLLCFQHKVD